MINRTMGCFCAAAIASFSLFGATCTWVGGGSDAKASTAANWVDEAVPQEGDDVVFDSGSAACTWDLDVKLGSWTQNGYTGTVTIGTVYDSAGFDCLEISGDCKVLTGSWTHQSNKDLNKTYRLYVSVGGNLEIGSAATIQATGAGYWRQYLLNGGKDCKDWYRGGTYGGFGGWNDAKYHPSVYGTVPYGSITAPEDLGSGTYGNSGYAGGGAIRLDVAGSVTHNGVISANSTSFSYYGGSGGSVYLRAGTITGTGTFEANSVMTGTSDYSAGSGGRIAIILTGSGADFGNYDALNLCSSRSVRPSGGTAWTRAGAPGTIYLETPADGAGKGWLIFKDGGLFAHTDHELCNGWPFDGNETTSAQFSRVTITNGACLVAAPGQTVDLSKTEFMTAGNAKISNGLVLQGGTVEFPTAATTIDYWLYSTAGGFSGLQGSDFTLVSPGCIEFSAVDATLPGNWTIGDGVPVKAGIPASSADHITLACTGNLTLNGSVKSTADAWDSNPKYLGIDVAGDFTIGESGLVDMTGTGYKAKRYPGGNRPKNDGASHGGWGLAWTDGNDTGSIEPYGSICNPMTAGPGGYNSSKGGGIIVMNVTGALTNNGIIRSADTVSDPYYRGTAGSINITAGEISGAGRITADAPESENHSSSGGGRVAIRLTKKGADFSAYTGRISAAGEYSSYNSGKMGGAGTVFLKTAAQAEGAGTLRIENFDTTHTIKYYGSTIVGGAVEGNAFGDILIGNKAKLGISENATLYVSGALSNGCQFVAQTGSTVVFTGTDPSRVYGNIDFCNLSAEAPGKTIAFDDGATITVTGEAALSGTSANNLTLASATQGQPWTLKGANVALNGVALRDCQSESAITVMNGTDLGGNSANVTFVTIQPGETLTWNGNTDAAWGNAANWDKNRTPISTDKIVVPEAAVNAPVLASDVTVAQLTVTEGGVIDVGSKTLTVAGPVAITGTIAAANGTLVAAGEVTLGEAGAKTLSLTLNGTAAQTATLTGAQLKTLTVANPSVTLAGTFVCTTFTAGDGVTAYDVAFAEGASIEADTFAFLGNASAKNGALRCATAGKKWFLNTSDASVTGATVAGSDASAGVLIVPTACVDGENNVNWLFNDTRAHWLGETSSDFATAANWSTGQVPDADTDVVIDTANPVVVSTDASVKSLALDPGAMMTVNAALAVGGSVVIGNGATIAWNRPGTIGGNLALLKGATLTHTANGTTEPNRIDLSVGGSVTVAASAKVDVKGKGYTKSNGPGANNSAPNGAPASHGGKTGPMYSYGSVLCPTNCGSGGRFSGSYTYAGGGAVKIVAAGAMTVNGTIDASGAMADYYTGSGGSVWLSCSTLAGSGSIRANGGNGYFSTINYWFGVGGRIALYETLATDFSAFTGSVEAYSGAVCDSTDAVTGNSDNSPGTVYRETAAQAGGHGTVTIVNRPGATVPRQAEHYMVDLPAAQYAVTNELANADIVLGEYGALGLTGDLKANDIRITGDVINVPLSSSVVTNLMLKGHTLKVHVRKHPVSSDDTKKISYDGGNIEWLTYGMMIIVR